MENIVVVGTGDLYCRFLAPALSHMQNKEINLLATIDIKPKTIKDEFFSKTEHRIRKSEQSLSDVLSDLKIKKPIIFLGHANDFHLKDAFDLLSKGFRVIMEKPYSTSKTELDKLKFLLKKYPSRLILADYYIKRKLIPLLVLMGATNQHSFYHLEEEVINTKDFRKSNLEFYGKLNEFLGKIVSAQVFILEGNQDSGRLGNRGKHLYDSKMGGGIIQDLGLHAVAPLFLLKNFIGSIDKSFKKGKVRTGHSKEYINQASNLFSLTEKEIAETYAEFVFSTSKKIPIKVIVGKYVKDREDQKKLILVGKKATLEIDLYKNSLYIKKNNSSKRIMELINAKHLRYSPVIKSSLEFFSEKNPFKFDINEVLFDSQEFILNVLKKSRQKNVVKIYDAGEDFSNIFPFESSISLGNLESLNTKNFGIFFKDYSRYLGNLLNKIDTSDLNKIIDVLLEARKNDKTIYFIGNGGSAATASHFSQDLAEVGRKLGCKVFNSLSFTDNVSGITAAANDHGYDKVFSFQMQGIFKKGDILFAISASGNSPNILEAVKLAKEKGGIVIGLVGFEGGKLLPMCDYTLHVKTQKGEYGPVEDAHMIFDHILTSYLYSKLREELR